MWICPHCGADVQDDWDVCWNCTQSRDRAAAIDSSRQAPILGTDTPARYEQCPRCQSRHTIPAADVVDTHPTGAVAIHIPEHPNAILFRGGVRSRLRAWVCGACGYTELFVDDPSLLWEAYQRSQVDTSEEGADGDDDAI